MITFFDLVQDNSFRTYVERRLAEGTKNPGYAFPTVFPALYKYRPMSKYAVEDIIVGHVTASSIGEFNDLFDGAMHNYGPPKARVQAAENEWNKLVKLGLPNGLLNHDDYVGLYAEHFKIESRLKFRELEYLGTYVCCLSSKCDSTLMWSHYANSNTGICIEYDFNNPRMKPLQRSMVFPVAYSQSPIDLSDLLVDEKCKKYQYPLEAAVLCAALNKASVWDYENEWRLVLVLAVAKGHERRLPLIAPSAPKSIAFGYHFLKPFFYYDHKNKDEQDTAKACIGDMLRLLEYVKKQEIPVSVMVPDIGGYSLSRKPVEVDALIRLINYHFDDNEPEDMRYYYVVHDELMDLLENDNE